MKELKFNISYLLKKREFYLAILITLLINLVHIFLCVNESIRIGGSIEQAYSGEYQFILYNPNVTLGILIIIVFPIILSMIFADSNWLEKNRKTTNILYTRLNYKKNITIRILLSAIISFLISFFSFSFNYFILRIIYGTGNALTYLQTIAFNISGDNLFFLDNVRLSNPVLFVFLINICVSLILSLLTVFSYLVSFVVKQRIVIYFIPLILLVFTELVFPNLGFKNLSLIKLLQPFSKFGIYDFIAGVGIILLINIILFIFKISKKDTIV